MSSFWPPWFKKNVFEDIQDKASCVISLPWVVMGDFLWCKYSLQLKTVLLSEMTFSSSAKELMYFEQPV